MSGNLPNWLARTLGVETSAGEGMAWGLASSWNWASWLLLVFAAAVVVFVGLLYWFEAGRGRSDGPRGCRCAATRGDWPGAVDDRRVGAHAHRTGLPYIVVLIDDSASMGIVDHYEDERLRATIAASVKKSGYSEASRFNLARSLLLEDDAHVAALPERKLQAASLSGLGLGAGTVRRNGRSD